MPTTISDQHNDDEAEHFSDQTQVLDHDGEAKLWNIDDSFRYAPEKPTDDPWAILLGPLLEKDKKQCNAWKDEVENLLIFAGLFSAVVTTLIVESYKNLQPDPNDAIISLLSRIATDIETFGNTSSRIPQVHQPLFVPTPSSIRVNVFWLVSLVLSLTTVLIGIICLQWLREHQSYPGLSPKETYALLHMRTQSLHEWHVPRIFRILPLVLQAALVLFLVGLIDFLSPFGKAVVTPVSLIIILTLSFLLYTSVYPAIEGITLFAQISWFRLKEKPPTPCPYKSPQAYISLNLAAAAFRTFYRMHKYLKASWFNNTYSSSTKERQAIGTQALSCIRKIYDHPGAWTQYDLTWLLIRDAYAYSTRRSLSEDELSATRTLSRDIFPMFDLVRPIIHNLTQKDDKNILAAEYHCISEISEALVATQRIVSWQDFQPQNDYLQGLLTSYPAEDVEHTRLSNVFRIPYMQFYNAGHLDVAVLSKVAKAFHHENLHIFANRMLQKYRDNKMFFHHRLEIKLRLMGYFHLESHGLRLALSDQSTAQLLPACLWIEFKTLYGSLGEPYEFYWQFALLISLVFERISEVKVISSHSPGHFQSSSGLLYHFPHLLRRARQTIRNISTSWSGPNNNHPLSQAILAKFSSTFLFINGHLDQELSHFDIDAHPSLLFYVASIHVKSLLTAAICFDNEINALLATLKLYKQKTIDVGICNSDVEGLFRTPVVYGPDIFSQEWWKFLNARSEMTSEVSDTCVYPKSV